MSDFYSDWGMPSWDDVPRWMKIAGAVVLAIVLAAILSTCGCAKPLRHEAYYTVQRWHDGRETVTSDGGCEYFSVVHKTIYRDGSEKNVVVFERGREP